MASKKQPVTSYKRIGSYPHTNVVASIATALFMIGLFCLFVLHADKLIGLIQEHIEVQVYLDREITPAQRDSIGRELATMKFVAAKAGQPRIRFVSKEEAADKMIKESGENFVEFLGENPLRDAFILNIDENYFEREKLQAMKKEIEALPGVFEVKYIESLIGEINSNIKKIGSFIAIFVMILLSTVVILIYNAVKLALFSQRFLIRSMQLVGATAFFIKRPFLIRAGIQGFLGGVIACTLLVVLLIYVNLQVEELRLLQDYRNIFALFMILICAGIFICTSSAYGAVTKYLKMSLDELY